MIKRFQDKPECIYDLPEAPSHIHFVQKDPREPAPPELKWGRDFPVPAIGTRVRINFDELGYGTVESYFIEHGWLGVCVKLDKIPDWKFNQQRDEPEKMEVALVFAIELDPYAEPDFRRYISADGDGHFDRQGHEQEEAGL